MPPTMTNFSTAIVWQQSDILCMVAATLGSLLWTAYTNAKKMDLDLPQIKADALNAGLNVAAAGSALPIYRLPPPPQSQGDRMTIIFAYILLLTVPLFIGFFVYWGFQNNQMERQYKYRNRVTVAQMLGLMLGLWALYRAHLSAIEEEERKRKRLYFKKEGGGYYLHPISLLLLPAGFLALRMVRCGKFCPAAVTGWWQIIASTKKKQSLKKTK